MMNDDEVFLHGSPTAKAIMVDPRMAPWHNFADQIPSLDDPSRPLTVLRVAADPEKNNSFEDIAAKMGVNNLRIGHLDEVFGFIIFTSRQPSMLIIDEKFLIDEQLSNEITVTIETLSKFKFQHRMKLAVGVTNPVDKHLLKRFKSLGFQGLVPDPVGFSYYLTLKSYEELLVKNNEFWPPECIRKNPDTSKIRTEDSCGIRLTERQQQVQKLLCERGLSNKAIARHLNISESTVKIHVSAILKRYAVRNRTQLALAVKNHARL